MTPKMLETTYFYYTHVLQSVQFKHVQCTSDKIDKGSSDISMDINEIPIYLCTAYLKIDKCGFNAEENLIKRGHDICQWVDSCL